MNYVGVDYHKTYSQITVLNGQGQVLRKGRISSDAAGFSEFFRDLEGPSQAVFEAGRNLCWVHDQLAQHVEKVTVAHPKKVKAIASAKIKTDEIDAKILADLLRADLIPPAHVPSDGVRVIRQVLHQRIAWVRMRTQIKNRIHAMVDQNPENRKGFEGTDLFGRVGITYLKELKLPADERRLLDGELGLLEEIEKAIKRQDRWIAKASKGHRVIELLRSIPGIGPFFAVLLWAEIDDIQRFSKAKKLCSYVGLVPSTYASGGRQYHGRITKEGNSTLRWAMVEAVRPAICNDWWLRRYYEGIKAKKGSNVAKIATARKVLSMVYYVWTENRPYRRVKGSGMSPASTSESV